MNNKKPIGYMMADLTFFPNDVNLFLSSLIVILTIINGFMLFRSYAIDKPKLKVKSIHPEVYQWFFHLPDGEADGKITRRLGFLAYISISNLGRRTVALESWRLSIRGKNFKKSHLMPLSIPEPKIHLDGTENVKIYPVLGTKGLFYEGQTTVEGGRVISGLAFYIREVWGDLAWDPDVVDNKIRGVIKVMGIYGRGSSSKVIFKKISLDWAKKFIPDVETIDSINNNPLSDMDDLH